MTWPMTLAGLPRAGAINFKAPWLHHKQNVQKTKGILKEWALTRNSWLISQPKNQTTQSSYGEQNKITTRPQGKKLNKNHVARKKLTGAKLKKSIQNETVWTLKD